MKITLVAAAALVFSAPAALAFAPVRANANAHRAASKRPVQLAAAVNIDESAPREVGAMVDWTTNCGVQRHPGFELTSEDGLDLWVKTNQDLPANTPVLKVPANMILSSSRTIQELQQMGANVEDAIDLLGRLGASDLVPQFTLVLRVLMEYQQGEDSPYYAWLNSLPRLYYNSASMTDFCYECLPPLVFSLTRIERVKFDNIFNALQKVDLLTPETKGERDLVKWAYNVVSTRCWGPDGGDKNIVPLADMFNHGTETEIGINYDGEGNCIAYTTRDVPAGSPLRMSYGDPTNPSQLLAQYGFLDETSPATFCKITINPTQQLRDMGYDHSRMLFYKDTGDISQEVWDVLLYQHLASNREAQQAFYEAHMAGDTETKKSIHQRYFLDTATALKKHVDSFLETLDELSSKAVGKDVKDHPRLPLILKHNEFVKSTFLKVKARLDPMVEQAAGERVAA